MTTREGQELEALVSEVMTKVLNLAEGLSLRMRREYLYCVMVNVEAELDAE